MNILSRLRLRTKLMLLMVLSALALLVSNGVASSIMRDRMVSDRVDKLQATVEMGLGVAASLESRVSAGELTREQAMTRLREAVHAMRFDEGDGYLTVQRVSDSVILAHGSDPSREGKAGTATASDGRAIIELIRDSVRGGNGTISYMFPKPGQTVPQLKVAYVGQFPPLNAIILGGAYTDDLDAAFRAALWNLAAVGGSILLITLAATWLVNRDITGSLGRLKSAMERLAGGELITEISGTERRDEVGEMAATVLIFRENMMHAAQLDARQQQDRAQAEEARRAAMVEMAEKIENEAKEALNEIAQRTTAMSGSAKNMTESAGRTGVSAQSAATAASQAMANVQTVASAAEELAASIREIGGQVSQSTKIVARAVEAGRETRQTIEALNTQVNLIGAVADMIGEIASKTNLLALNATIEAARAGDAGKGFAVVASEVKQLAMQSARSTQEIARHLAEVRTATGASVAAVGRIETTINEVNAIAGSIAAAVEQQGAATAEIARNVTETASAANSMTERSSEVAAEAERTGMEASEVLENITRLDGAVHELQRSMIRVVRTATSDVDRRESRRRPCLVEASISGGGQSSPASIQDISESGCFLTTTAHFHTGQELAIELTRFGTRLRGTVAAEVKDGLHVTFSGDGLAAGEADRISLTTIPDIVKLTKSDHVAFVKRVIDAVAARGALPANSLATQHDCRLGRWYDGVSDPATLALRSFRAIARPHQAVHDSGRDAMAALASGNIAEAERCATALQRHSEEVLRSLDAFGAEFPGTITSRAAA